MSNVLSASTLMAVENSKSGYVEKKSNSFYSKVFPCATDPFVRRFIVLSGSYLYRFTDMNNSKPKGVPIPIESITVEKIDEFSFCLKAIRKSYIFRALSMEDCRSWAKAINERKLMAVKETMGHAEVSSQVVRSNRAAGQLYEEAIRREGMNTSMNPLMHVN